VPEEHLASAQDDATYQAIKLQEEAGLDIITDGEIRRESYSNRFANALDGLDLVHCNAQTLQMSRSIKVPEFSLEIRGNIRAGCFCLRSSGTLIVAPSGACHSAHSCVAALEKGVTIPFELRLAVNQMTNSHSQRLHVTVH